MAIMEINFIITELLKILKQAHFKLAGVKLDRVKAILENHISAGYTISGFSVFRKANLINRCQDDRHVKFNIQKDNEDKCIEISIEEV
ncbi:MAG: hypothetical protein A2287_03270 [Candidatus Melainabacteria bacterium RIFOXYA12_FULL_32_12]|nr:MAG: hypothetical protein A2255_06120 [Candidatus Melainabacteria bacterium RIFOXYA2_FULL_32_9]OGI30521.1 MAG: hypothetical protein A2287_03270 [Candidatus Melainabacteria bacterium RIFOXYA12_FULL_32_12]